MKTSNIIAKIAAAGMLAMAATPALSIASLAHAGEVKMSVADLNLADQAAVDARIAKAADAACKTRWAKTGDKMPRPAACKAEVKAKFAEQAELARTSGQPTQVLTIQR